ncbi:hypothetical protein VSU19_16410 [Verrucomicrobiales bacterium BCK34]|nr:hypothetical protein [Verrucomicrobiales bacterium BCK34]
METTPVSGTSGLSDISWYRENSVVGVWRNCACTSTMLVLCSDRRDISEVGRARRERFGVRMKVLCENGVNSCDARAMLLNLQKESQS